MTEFSPFLGYAQMWLRHRDQPAPERKGQSLMRFHAWARRSRIDPMPLTSDLIARHVAWLRTPLTEHTVSAAEADLESFAEWLYEPLVESRNRPSNPNS